MDLKAFRNQGTRGVAVLLPLLFGAGNLFATNLISTTAATVSCSTTAGPGTAAVITVSQHLR